MARTGETVSYGELTERSRRAAHLLRDLGATHGTCVALLMENHLRYLELAWAAQRAGLRYTAVSPRLTADEVAYILEDSGARILFASAATAELAGAAAAKVPGLAHVVSVDGDYDALVAEQPADAARGRARGPRFPVLVGDDGATEGDLGDAGAFPDRDAAGDRAAVRAPLRLRFGHGLPLAGTALPLGAAALQHGRAPAGRHDGGDGPLRRRLGARADRAPSHHARRRWSRRCSSGCCGCRKRRARGRDLSSLRAVVHAAAPCPPDVKAAMIEWLGPIVYEYYSATEVYLLTAIDSEDWLAHRGSVGKALLGTPHILDDAGHELPAGEPGTVWSEGGAGVRVPQRSREDRGLAQRARLDDGRRHRLPRRGRLSLPDRPQGRHDHLRRRQRLSAGSRERTRRPPCRRRRRGLRDPASPTSARRSRASSSCGPAGAPDPSSRPS